MKPAEFHHEAAAEFEAAVDYYENCAPGLGVDLRQDVEAAVKKIQARPSRWPLYGRRARRYYIRRFSYLVIFLELPNNILIVAVAHGRRRPGYWKHRI